MLSLWSYLLFFEHLLIYNYNNYLVFLFELLILKKEIKINLVLKQINQLDFHNKVMLERFIYYYDVLIYK